MSIQTYHAMEQSLRYLLAQQPRHPSLEELAGEAGLSPTHFQRQFSEWIGLSPARFARYVTKEHMRSKLKRAENIEHAADLAGLSSPSRLYDLFVTMEAVTPGEYREQGKGLCIRHSIHDTLLGHCFIAVTERGVCALAFVDEETGESEQERLAEAWPGASLREDHAATAEVAAMLFPREGLSSGKLHLLVRGTNFQTKVWEALLRIPPGQVSTYSRIAEAIGSPSAQRAVGGAVGANPIAVLIPCHRVIRESGVLGHYRWNPERKAALLAWEQGGLEAAK